MDRSLLDAGQDDAGRGDPVVVLEAEVCEARRGGEMRQEELTPASQGAGWLPQASFGFDPTYSFKEGVTPNKGKLLSEARSAMQGLWPQGPPCPRVVATKLGGSHPLLSSAWNILLLLLIVQDRCPPPQRGLS